MARKSVVTIFSENADFKFKRKNGQLHVKGTPDYRIGSKKDEKVEVLELDELCVNKKHLALDLSRPRYKAALRFQIGTRETGCFQKLTDKISYIDAKFYASDHWHTYNLIESRHC